MASPAQPEHIPADRPLRARHAEIKPIRGNARRRTITLLAATGVAVLCVRFAPPLAGPISTLAGAPPSAGTSGAPPPTFYLSADGSDSAAGTSPATAWRTLARADRHVFTPGERLLLQGGATFVGELTLKPGEAGRAAQPVQVGSYGAGRAVIDAAQTPAISVFDTAGVAISDVTLIGAGAGSSLSAGVDVYNNLPGNRLLTGISIAQVDVSGFQDGIAIGGGNGTSGFADVRISASAVHNNRDNGLVTYGPPQAAQGGSAPNAGYQFHGVQVLGVRAYDNAGDPADHTTSTGNGIDLGGVDGGLVAGSVAFGNGSACNSLEGPVGIWANDSTGVVIEHNVSYANRTGGYTDGGGFDLDQGTHNSVLQYNLSYDNYGPGYMVWSGSQSASSSGNTVRFNVSMNDARSPLDANSITYGALMLAGYQQNATLYHNTVLQTIAGEQSTLVNLGVGVQGGTVRDNILVAEGGTLVNQPGTMSTQQIDLQGNCYYSVGGTWRIDWAGQTYSSLSAWRAATGEESLGGQPTGSSANPDLVPAGPASWDPTHTGVFAPAAGSAATTSGLDLAARFGTSGGTQDYLGPARTAQAAIGAIMPPTAGKAAAPAG